MTQGRKLLILVAVAVLNLLFLNTSFVADETRRATGLNAATPEELKRFKTIKVKRIHPNKLGLERINKARAEKGEAPLPAPPAGTPEVEGDATFGAIAPLSSGETFSATSLPAAIDNSILPSFPPIGDQGTLGSCAAWTSTYYQMSHEVCLTLNCNNKVSGGKIFSPRWTYNLTNLGSDGGSTFPNNFGVTTGHGAALVSEFPISTEYRAWDLNPEHWKSAIKYKLQDPIEFILYRDAEIEKAKQWLNNGHVVTLGTHIYSFHYTTVRSNPNASSNPFAGQQVVYYVDQRDQGRHAMTIVGYDDSVWTDINSNGIVDAGELGAFKLANQWGTSWGNKGFMWVAYDALYDLTRVAGWTPPIDRGRLYVSASSYGLSYLPYTPKLLVKVTLSHLLRKQIFLTFGASDTSQSTTPQKTWKPTPLYGYQGGPYGFAGTTAEVDGTFYLDADKFLISQDLTVPQNIYVYFQDSTVGDPLTIKQFQLIDAASGNVVASLGNVPFQLDGSLNSIVLNSLTVSPAPTPVSDTVAPSAPSSLVGAVQNVKKGKRITTTASLTWLAASDNVAVVKYYIYRNGVKIAESTSLNFSEVLSVAGSYIYEVSAVDAAGNVSLKSNAVTVAK